VNVDALLDLVQRLLSAAQHPDVSSVERYDGAAKGVVVTYRSGAKVFFAGAAGKPRTEPAGLGDDLGPWKFRRNYAMRMLLDVLEVARPAGLSGWRTVAIEKVDVKPGGIELVTDSGPMVLHVTSGGPMILDSDPADFAGWRVPDGIVVS